MVLFNFPVLFESFSEEVFSLEVLYQKELHDFLNFVLRKVDVFGEEIQFHSKSTAFMLPEVLKQEHDIKNFINGFLELIFLCFNTFSIKMDCPGSFLH